MISNSGSLDIHPAGAQVISLAQERTIRGLPPSQEPIATLGDTWRVGDECLIPNRHGQHYLPAIITGIDREVSGGKARVCPLSFYGAAFTHHPLAALRIRPAGHIRPCAPEDAA